MFSSSAVLDVDPRGLVPIAVTTLQAQEELSFDLFLWPSKNTPPVLYCEKRFPLKPIDLERLLDQNIATLYMRITEAQEYCTLVRTQILVNEELPVTERYCLLKNAARTVLMASFESRDVDCIMSTSGALGRDMASLFCGREDALHEVLKVMTHDYTTFTHIANVCTYCLILAESYGIHDEKQLADIAQGALLHDVGKCYIPSRILNKTTRLTKEEQDLIRQHPTRGFEELCSRPDLNWGQLMMVYHHHERFDGRGYPAGLVGSEIHEWGRLCAVVDVYDALKRDRPYRKGADAKDILEYMDRESGRSFDEDICQCWIAALKECQT